MFLGSDHVSITVNNIEKSLAFYEQAFGSKLIYKMGPFDAEEIPAMEDGRDWSEAHINVPGVRLNIAMVQLFDNLRVELFQYDKPETASRFIPSNGDTGASHICIKVKDILVALQHLESLGCTKLAGPISSVDGPCPDSDSWYVIDPFGHQLELVQYL
ncbi:VOC family protein [Aestuariicella hydrocarbonica]|uniref:VOC family protein n=1 Tax=Pseudomaricurvus hydrocarbonicus TaxID=1470433 RepID=A0A9E5MQ08_9GAMM|nr:VOC family protein [Aestuariicella hydrocarbonica]